MLLSVRAFLKSHAVIARQLFRRSNPRKVGGDCFASAARNEVLQGDLVVTATLRKPCAFGQGKRR